MLWAPSSNADCLLPIWGFMGCPFSQNQHHMPWEEAQSPVFSWDPQGALPEPVVQAAREKAEMLSEAQAEDR